LLKRSFFQLSERKRKKTLTAQASKTQPNKNNQDSDLSTSSSEDDIEPTLPIIKRKKKTKTTVVSAQVTSNDPTKSQFANLEPVAKNVIQTIINCKKLVKYVKKVS
jgi:hypothetical protein